MSSLVRTYPVSGDDISLAGEVSGRIKQLLKALGFAPEVVRRVAISAYEAEVNMVIHADGGEIRAEITPEYIEIAFADTGPGIPDIELAMQEGWSTAPHNARALGFGAGMGLPNIKKHTDVCDIQTEVGVGTTLTFRVCTGEDTGS